MENDKLDKIFELCQENNKILRGIQRGNRFGRIFRLVYWIIILGSLVGTYYYVQPYIDQLLQVYEELNSSVRGIENKANQIPNVSNLNLPPEIFKQLDNLFKPR